MRLSRTFNRAYLIQLLFALVKIVILKYRKKVIRVIGSLGRSIFSGSRFYVAETKA